MSKYSLPKVHKSITTTQHSTSGFTIVELLIVIVVIAILAAISIVSYTGIQQKAYNVARISAAKNAIDLVTMYVAGESQYPFTTGTGRCLGEGFPDDICWGIDSPSPGIVTVQLLDELRTYGTLPKISTPPVSLYDWQGAWQGIGPVYHYNKDRTVDGKSAPVVVVYFLDGTEQDCGIGRVVRPVDPGVSWRASTIELETVTEQPRFTLSNAQGKGTHCVVSIDGPAV